MTVLLTRLLDTAEYGIYAQALSWSALLAVPLLVGLPRPLTRELAKARARTEWGQFWGLVRSANVLLCQTTVGASLLVAALLVTLYLGDVNPYGLLIATAAVPMTLLTPFLRMIQSVYQALDRVVKGQTPLMVLLPGGLFALIGLAAIAGVDVSAARVIGARGAVVLAALAVALYGLHQVRSKSRQEAGAAPGKIAGTGLKWPLLTPFLLLDAAVVVNDHVAVALLGILDSPSSAAVFDVARRPVLLMTFLLLAMDIPLAPIAARLHATEDLERLEVLAVRASRVALTIGVMVVLGLTLFARPLLGLFGPEFRDGAPVLVLLSVAHLINVGCGSVGVVLNMSGHEVITARVLGLSAGLHCFLAAVGILLFSAVGAAVSVVVTVTVWNVILARRIHRSLGIHVTALGPIKVERKG